MQIVVQLRSEFSRNAAQSGGNKGYFESGCNRPPEQSYTVWDGSGTTYLYETVCRIWNCSLILVSYQTLRTLCYNAPQKPRNVWGRGTRLKGEWRTRKSLVQELLLLHHVLHHWKHLAGTNARDRSETPHTRLVRLNPLITTLIFMDCQINGSVNPYKNN
jgi:hypothetical protein